MGHTWGAGHTQGAGHTGRAGHTRWGTGHTGRFLQLELCIRPAGSSAGFTSTLASAVTHLAVAASNAKSALQHPWLSYSRGHQCPLKGSVDHRHSLVFLTQVVGGGDETLPFQVLRECQGPDLPEKHWWAPSTRIVWSCSEEGPGPYCGTAWQLCPCPSSDPDF